jgi:hypothetical protein
MKKKNQYKIIGKEIDFKKENYLFLSGTVYGPNEFHLNKEDQCFCQDLQLKTKNNPQGQCYPVQLCNDCNLNLSGLCPQQSDSTYPGV